KPDCLRALKRRALSLESKCIITCLRDNKFKRKYSTFVLPPASKPDFRGLAIRSVKVRRQYYLIKDIFFFQYCSISLKPDIAAHFFIFFHEITVERTFEAKIGYDKYLVALFCAQVNFPLSVQRLADCYQIKKLCLKPLHVLPVPCRSVFLTGGFHQCCPGAGLLIYKDYRLFYVLINAERISLKRDLVR